MWHDTQRFLDLWSPESIEKLKRKGCGVMNCRSGLGGRNPAGAEIDQIFRNAFSVGKEEEKPDPTASRTD